MSSLRPFPSPPHLVAALVTPFTSERTIDRASLTRLVTALRDGGVDEYFVVSSTGEAPLLDESERSALIETVRLAAPAGTLYAGVSGAGGKTAVRLAREAQRAGADVAVLMSPFFLAFDQEQLTAYGWQVAEESPLPVALYHHLRMPTPWAVPTVARLADHPNLIGIKDTNGADHNRCAEILAATAGRPFRFFQGVEKLALETLAAGGHGVVLAQATIAPQLFRALFTAWQAGDQARAQALQERITALWGIFSRREVRQSFCHFLHTLKLPLQRQGVLATTLSAMPGAHFKPEFERAIEDFMREQGVLPAKA